MNATTLDTAAAAARRLAARGAARRAFGTPGLLRLMLGGTWALSAAFVLMAVVGLDRHRHALRTIGRDTAPSIIAAQHLRTTFAWAQADALRCLAGEAGAAAAYDGHRREAADELVAAAENITYGDAERVPVRRMVDGFGRYGAAVARGRALAGGPSPAALADADRVLHDGLLADADALDRANRDALEQGYAAERSGAAWALAGTCAAAASLLGGLVGTQAFLTRRTRRVLNPPLVVASALTVAMLAWLVVAMAGSAADLRSAKFDAFDSISALWQARAYGVDGYAARLAGPAAAARAAADDARLAAPPGGMTLDGVVSAVDAGDVPQEFSGYLAAELRNVTFPGERDAAADTLRSYAAYEAGGGGAAFARFDAALGRTLEVNQSAFDASVGRGLDALDGLGTWAALTAGAISLAAYLGLRPRLREYAA